MTTTRPGNILFGRVLRCAFVVVGMSGLMAQDFASAQFTSKGSSDWLYFDLGCEEVNWEGYFAPHRWTVQGTFDQDVSTHEIIFPADSTALTHWSIEIPANGILSFSMRGGAERLQEVKLLLDGIDQRYRIADGETVYTPYLRSGERFELEVPGGAEAIHWTDLSFHTNARGVFILPGESDRRQRYRSVERDHLDRVQFPKESYRSWPYFDFDGYPESTDDQVVLDRSTDRLEVNFRDELGMVDGQYYLLRHFSIREKCNRGNVLKYSAKWMPLPLVAAPRGK